MILTLDNLAHRYQCLPSYALANASTFDLYVLDVSARWERYQRDLADGKIKPRQPDEQQMLELVKRAKEKQQ